MKSEITAKEIVEILRLKHRPPEWSFFEELRCGTGYGKKAEQRLDAWAIHMYPSKKHLKITYEIKVYRSDFMKELKDTNKKNAGLEKSNLFYYVAPPGVIKLDEIPIECGYIEIKDGKSRIVKEAPLRTCSNPNWNFLSSIARRTAKAEIFNLKHMSDDVLRAFMIALHMGDKTKLTATEYLLFHYLNNERISRSQLKQNRVTKEQRSYNSFVKRTRKKQPLLSWDLIDALWKIELEKKKKKA